MKFSKIALALIVSGLSSASIAETFEDANFEQITVTSSRFDTDIDEIASSVSVIDSEQMDKMVATDIRDLVRFEPGVVVEGGGRFGLSGFNIRGINADRVLMLLDGAPIADEFSFGPGLSARRDFIDVDMIDRVEIIRGPASTLYGSDAIGGVVSFISKDPNQLLDDDEQIGGRVKVGYASVANEWMTNAQLYGRNGDWQWLLNATARNGSETENYFDGEGTGLERNATNPQDNSTESAQLKLIYQPNEAHRLEFLADYLQGETETNVLSQVDTFVRGVRITESQGIDERDRTRLQLNHTYSNETALFDKVLTRVYWQETDNVQATREGRFGAASRQEPTPVQLGRTRDSEFNQKVEGVIVQLDKQFTTGDVKHHLIYGSELQYTDSEALREGTTFVAETGAIVPEFSVFPARDFPISKARELSFFVQDEISLLDGRLTLSPGVRYDEFKLTPYPDEIFINANPGVEAVPFDDSQVSLKLGAVYDLNETTNVWLQYAEGFRIPPFDDLNVGFTNFAGGYTSLPNPNLEPESVESWEVGVRQRLDAVKWSVSAYHNNYDNFIESRATIGFNPATQLLEFQATNRDSVVIEGIDAQVTWFLGESFSGLNGWELQGALTWLDSEDEATGQEIESILPPQAVVGIGYTDSNDIWSVELIGTFVQRFDSQNQPEDPAEPRLFEAPGYAQFDLLANYNVSEDLTVNLGIFNIFDRKSWSGTEVRGLDVSDATNVNFLTQPGINAAVNATYSF
ncbi:TonB-dependent hemoglobin/transferrin/lactoferrin family receptor [Alteromonas sp. S167]|uniref:TonB-dependent hemoglobin/transferrin/lactoferrin family receptor n=1 Tax=Alteromonas sp. S167 TaxID=3117402 RepID=UPI002FE01508